MQILQPNTFRDTTLHLQNLFLFPARINARLCFAEAVEEEIVVPDGLLDELLQEEQFGTIDDRVNTLLKRVQR